MKSDNITSNRLESAIQRVIQAGYTPCLPSCYENEAGSVYAASIETVPGTFGHPQYETCESAEGIIK